MNFYQKRKIKDFFKNNWKPLVATGAFALTALIVMLVGFAISGWSLVAWLKSRFAVSFFIMVGFGVFGSVILFYFYNRIHKEK